MSRLKVACALALCALCAVASAGSPPAETHGPVATVSSGALQGARTGNIDAFLGVPYATAPVGELRWRAPRPPGTWSGSRSATTFGASCYQEWPARTFGPYTAEYVETPKHSEDCLYLNVWTPAKRRAPLPVLVWIHGGGFGGGSGAVPIYDGANLAAQGIVVVTINYRVGPFGFLAHPELTREAAEGGSGNFGLQDMIAALRWVQQNVRAFGGDPGRVTVAGQSAGAIAVNDLIVSPAAAGLFARAIAQSGSGMGIDAIPLHEAESNGVSFATQLGASSVAELRALPPERIQAAIPSYFSPPPAGAPPRIEFRPVLDNVVLRVDPIDGHAAPVSNVPLVTGFNADEFMPAGATTVADFERGVRSRFGAAADGMLALYPHATDAEATDSARLLARDAYMASLYLWAEDRTRVSNERVYVYLFEHPEPVASGPSFGTFHTSEIPYLFGVLDRARRPFTEEDERVSAQLQAYWLNFVRGGDPNGRGLALWRPLLPGSREVMGLGDRVGPRAAVSSDARLSAFEAYTKAGGRLSVR